jgi:hypothetical protein
VLDSGFAIFHRTVLRCLPYALIAVIAPELTRLHDIAVGHSIRRFGGNDPIWWGYFVLGAVLATLFWSALLIRQRALAAGMPTGAGAELRTALRRLPRLIVLAVCLALAVGLGTAALVIPGVYLLPSLAFAAPALLLDRKGPIDALLYSSALVYRHWWRTLMILLVGLAVLSALYGFVLVVIAVVFTLRGTPDLAVVAAVTTATGIILAAALMPFLFGLVLASYGELRVRREGVDLERRIAALGS